MKLSEPVQIAIGLVLSLVFIYALGMLFCYMDDLSLFILDYFH